MVWISSISTEDYQNSGHRNKKDSLVIMDRLSRPIRLSILACIPPVIANFLIKKTFCHRQINPLLRETTGSLFKYKTKVLLFCSLQRKIQWTLVIVD